MDKNLLCSVLSDILTHFRPLLENLILDELVGETVLYQKKVQSNKLKHHRKHCITLTIGTFPLSQKFYQSSNFYFNCREKFLFA